MVDGLGYWARARLRRQVGATIGLAAIIAIGIAVPVAGWAGARRTASVLPRVDEELKPFHARVVVDGPDAAEARATLAGLTEIEAIGTPAWVVAKPSALDIGLRDYGGLAAVDETFGVTIDGVRLHQGRHPATDAPDEVLMSPVLADRIGAEIGDVVPFDTLDAGDAFTGEPAGPGPQVDLQLVGLGTMVAELYGDTVFELGAFLVGPAFFERWRDEIVLFGGGTNVSAFDVRAAPGVGPEELRAAVSVALADTHFEYESNAAELGKVRDAVRIQEQALVVFTVAAALAALVLCGQAMARHMRRLSDDAPVLRSLGARSRSQRLAAVGTAGPALIVGGLSGAGAAWGVSGILPLGLAGRLEPPSGLRFDALAVGVGAAGAIVLLGVVAAASGGGRRSPPHAARSAAVPLTFRRPVTTLGARFALAGRRSASSASGLGAAAQQAVAGVAVGLAGVLGVITFAASQDRLVSSPERWGSPWDLEVVVPNDGDETAGRVEQVSSDLAALDWVEELLVLRNRVASLEGVDVPLYGWQPVRGDWSVSIVEGRAPVDGEIVLGVRTLRALDRRIGDEVLVGAAGAGSSLRLRISGSAVVPITSHEDPTLGGIVTPATLDLIDAPEGEFPAVAVRLAPGIGVGDALTAVGAANLSASSPQQPALIGNLREVDEVPWAIGAFVGALAVLSLVHALVTTLRTRRRDLAVARALGFTPRQAGRVLTVQALTTMSVGALIGVPLGVAVGRQTWRTFVEGMGLAADPVAVWSAAALAVLGGVGAAVGMAAVPALGARRLAPAHVLRGAE